MLYLTYFQFNAESGREVNNMNRVRTNQEVRWTILDQTDGVWVFGI